MKVVVVGGGLSGLSFANRLLETDAGVDLEVLEASEAPGGILGTVERDGLVIETGPDSILSSKPAAVALAERLGLGDRIIETNDEHRGAYVVNRGRLEAVPPGFSLMAPTRFGPWIGTPTVSLRGRVRAALDLVMPARDRAVGEESMGRFVRRRFGHEIFERLAQPLVGGIYGGDPERLSLEATMPRFVDLEAQHGSVVRGMLDAERRSDERAAGGARYGLFVAFDRGMQVLVDALRDRVGERLRTNAAVRAVRAAGGGYDVELEGEILHADVLVLALPSWRTAGLLEPLHRPLADALHAIRYGSAATVTFAWPREDVPHPMEAFGFVVPKVERRSVLAATFSSVKWPGRAPASEALIRVFIGGETGADAVRLDDDYLIATARRELERLMGIRKSPSLTLVRRYLDAMPQYELGHLARVATIEALTEDLPRLFVAGNAYRGVGIPDTVAYAERVAERCAESLTR